MSTSDADQAFLTTKRTEHSYSLQCADPKMYRSKPGLLYRWSSSWQAPTTMISLLLLGCGLAIGHHFFYQSLDTTRTPDGYLQQRNSAYGTAFAFSAKACLIAAVGSAYTQHMWSDFRQKSLRIATIDSTFTATSSIFSLLDPKFLWSCKLGAVIAALAWLLPISAIITPGTLSVRSVLNSTTTDLLVPIIDFPSFENYREADSVKASLSRLARLVTSSSQIPPLDAAVANSTYTLEIVGPSLKCDTPSPDVTENIDAIFEGTSESVEAEGSTQLTSVYVAFTPFTPVTYSGRAWLLDDVGQVHRNSSDWDTFISSCIKNKSPSCSLIAPTMFGIPDDSTAGYGKTIDTANALWLRFGDERLSCSVQKSRYKLDFDARHPITALKGYTSENEGVFESDSLEHAGLITAVQPLLDILTGATNFNHRWCYLSMMQMDKCTSDLSYVVSQTSIHETALTALVYGKAAEIRNKTWALVSNEGIFPPSNPVPSSDPLDALLTRNLTLRELIEDMSRNMTISYLSDARYLSYNTTTVAVTTTNPINVYSYNARNLTLAYGVAIGTSTLAVVVGMYVFLTNGLRNGTGSFSSIVWTTMRNQRLADAVEQIDVLRSRSEYTRATMVASPEVLELRLRYGTLLDDDRLDAERASEGMESGSARVEAFGLPSQVSQ